jgi:hypothetical protein
VRSSTFNFNLSILFPLRVTLAAFIILIGYNAFVAIVRPNEIVEYDSGIRNRIIAEQYADWAVPEVVLVGSSLGVRLASDFMGGSYLGPHIFNLSLAGQNSATGMNIILHKDKLPAVVLAEMNVTEHPYDPGLATEAFEEPWKFLRRVGPGFRLENRPFDLGVLAVAKAVNYLLDKAGMVRTERIFVSQPSGAKSEHPDSPQSKASDGLDKKFVTNVQTGLATIGSQFDALRSKNVKLILLRFPIDPSVNDTPRERYKREEAYKRFPPEAYDWHDLQKSGTETYLTSDGIHLVRSSARNLALAIRKIVDADARNRSRD